MKKGGQSSISQSNSWRKLLVVVVIIVVIGGVYLLYSYGGSGEENLGGATFLDSCLNSCGSCEQNCYDMDYMEKSRSESDESLCDKIKDERLMNECKSRFIFTKAIESGDVNLCNDIVDETEKGICINSVEYSLNPPEITGE